MATSHIHFPTRFLKVTFTFLKVTTVHSHFPLGFPQFTFTFPKLPKLNFYSPSYLFFYFCFSLSYKLPTNHSYFPLLLYLFTFLSTFLFFHKLSRILIQYSNSYLRFTIFFQWITSNSLSHKSSTMHTCACAHKLQLEFCKSCRGLLPNYS